MTFDEFVGEIVARQTAWLESLLRQLIVGESLCVHEPPGGVADSIRITLTAHTLAEGVTCRVQGPMRKTQYGPMTAEILAAIDKS